MADRAPTAHLERWRVKPGHDAGLARRDPASTAGAPGDRAATELSTETQVKDLAGLQDRLWAEARRSVLVVLQGIDAAGKDGTIKHVFRGVNPQGVRVAAFKEPTPLERAHDFLWRVHEHVPAAGEIGIFNRSHYEDVIVPRVHRLLPDDVVRPRYDHIIAFERLLASAGTLVVKLFLHISFEEQGRRLADRLERPDKRWKMSATDLVERDSWERYQQTYEEVLTRTSVADTPWFVIPADHKWYRNWAVGEILLHALGEIDPRYPTRGQGQAEPPPG
ncbi:MAG TPA: PPK2 family polyphosphate kinase [Acidimicrobiales bacterium]|nr:PPK2 family polyphosphate kinase [Acidimicrobiales bacterium]